MVEPDRVTASSERPLQGRRALVTAGSGKLGAAIARALASRGATVAVNHRSSAKAATALVEALRAEHGGDHLAVRADVTDPAQVAAMAERLRGALGRVDILVNNAGPFSSVPFAQLPERDWDRVWDTNVAAIHLCARALAPAMRRAGRGRVVNVSAVSAAVRNRSVYGLAKAAVEALTEQLALELGPEVTVNAVAPGQIVESLEEMAGVDPAWARTVVARTPAGRLVTRAEVAEVVALLCSPAFDGLTGTTVPLDGGLRTPTA